MEPSFSYRQALKNYQEIANEIETIEKKPASENQVSEIEKRISKIQQKITNLMKSTEISQKDLKNFDLISTQLSGLKSNLKIEKADTLGKNVLDTINKTEKNNVSEYEEHLIDDFLKLPEYQQEIKLNDLKFLNEIKKIIKKYDHSKIKDEETKDILLHQFIQSPSKQTRSLALVCLESGADVNQANINALPLHLAVFYEDQDLIHTLLNTYHAKQIKTKLGTPIEYAKAAKKISCALLLALANSKFTPDRLIKEFKSELNLLEILKIIDVNFKKKEIDTEKIWIYLNKLIDAAQFCNNKQLKTDIEILMSWLLKNQKAFKSEVTAPFSKEKMQAVRYFAKNSMSQKGNVEFLNAMIENQHLPTILLQSNHWFLNQILENKKIQLDSLLKSKIENLYETYKNLYALTNKFKGSFPPKKLSKIYEKIVKELNELKKEYPNIDVMENAIKEQFSSKIEKIQEYKKILIALEREDQSVICSDSLHYDMALDFIDNNQMNLLEQLLKTKKENINKKTIAERKDIDFNYKKLNFTPQDINTTIFQLFCDKLFFSNLKDQILDITYTVGSLIHAIDSIHQTLSKNKNLPEIEALSNHMITYIKPVLEEFVINHSFTGDQLVKKLKELQLGNSFLLFTGAESHATVLQITKSTLNTFGLIIYNTGLGLIGNHPRWLSSEKFQTYAEIKNINNDIIINPSSWELLNSIRKSGSKERIYKYIFNALGKGGERGIASQNEEDYEACQSSDTCSMQAFMAYLRHQIMCMYEGSPAEKEALYKIYKANMLIQFHTDRSHKINQKIQNYLPTALKKMNAENELIRIAAKPLEFEKVLNNILKALEKTEEKDTVQIFKNIDPQTTLARYALLRKVSIKLAAAWLSDSKQIPESIDKLTDYQFALAKFERYSLTVKNVIERLKFFTEQKNETEYLSQLIQIYVRASLQPCAIDILANLCQSNKMFAKKVLEKLYDMKGGDFVFLQLVSHLQKNGNSETSQWVENYLKSNEDQTLSMFESLPSSSNNPMIKDK